MARVEDPQAHAFLKQASTDGVAIGPLEYASNGRVHTFGKRVVRYALLFVALPDSVH